jgi:hypothetical protein
MTRKFMMKGPVALLQQIRQSLASDKAKGPNMHSVVSNSYISLSHSFVLSCLIRFQRRREHFPQQVVTRSSADEFTIITFWLTDSASHLSYIHNKWKYR